MFNGYFAQALREEFYRVLGHSPAAYIVTTGEARDYADFGRMYLAGDIRDLDRAARRADD